TTSMDAATWHTSSDPIPMLQFACKRSTWRQRCRFVVASWNAAREHLDSRASRDALAYVESVVVGDEVFSDSFGEMLYEIGFDECEDSGEDWSKRDIELWATMLAASTVHDKGDDGQAFEEWRRIETVIYQDAESWL